MEYFGRAHLWLRIAVVCFAAWSRKWPQRASARHPEPDEPALAHEAEAQEAEEEEGADALDFDGLHDVHVQEPSRIDPAALSPTRLAARATRRRLVVAVCQTCASVSMHVSFFGLPVLASLLSEAYAALCSLAALLTFAWTNPLEEFDW